MANEYVTSTVLKATLSLTGETFADADVASAVEAASRAVDGICDRRFYADADATQIRYFTALSGRSVWVDDLVTITTVATDTTGDGTFPETLTANTDYVAYPLNAAADSKPWTRLEIHPQSGAYFPVNPRSVKVTGKYGWSAVPAAITQATTILASALLKRSREAPFGIVTFGVEAGAAERIARSDPHVMALVSPYVRLSAG